MPQASDLWKNYKIGFSGQKCYTIKVHASRLSHLVFVNSVLLCKLCKKMHYFPEKNYTAGTNFTQLLVATFVTNLNSAKKNGIGGSVWILFVHVVQIYSSFIDVFLVQNWTENDERVDKIIQWLKGQSELNQLALNLKLSLRERSMSELTNNPISGANKPITLVQACIFHQIVTFWTNLISTLPWFLFLTKSVCLCVFEHPPLLASILPLPICYRHFSTRS